MDARPARALSPSGSARVSRCGRYRYRLERRWAAGAPINFVMLNPSTADAVADDPTLRRCVGFARAWGYGALIVTNLFAYRATDPRDLARVADPVGPDNDAHLVAAARAARLIVCAWGASRLAGQRQAAALAALRSAGRRPMCLALAANGQPKHPLYLPGALTPRRM